MSLGGAAILLGAVMWLGGAVILLGGAAILVGDVMWRGWFGVLGIVTQRPTPFVTTQTRSPPTPPRF